MKTSDGVRIAYYAVGSGEPLLVIQPLGASHLNLECKFPGLADWYSHISEYRTLIRLDFRNSGLSDRKVADISDDAYVRDVEAVCEHLRIEEADMLASGPGTFSALRVAGQKPLLARKLVLTSPVLRGSDYYPGPQGRTILALAEQDWDLFVQTATRARLGWSALESQVFAEIWQASFLPDDYIRAIPVFMNLELAPLLEHISAQTLVLYASSTRFAKQYHRAAREIASSIPGTKVFDWSDGFVHWMQSPSAVQAIDEFLGIPSRHQFAQSTRAPSSTAVILFADIVDSTALTERLGDGAFRAKARDLDAALRSAIREHAGTAIEGKLLGDGVLAVFASARQAIEAALACGRSGDAAALPLHLGLHAGDVIREENNVYGGAVNIASRISGLSASGEVLVSDTVRSLARTSAGVTFEDRGEQALKGVGEPVRVWVVREGA